MVFFEISQDTQENTWARASFLKKRLWHRYFPVYFAKFLRTPCIIEHLWWLLLQQDNFKQDKIIGLMPIAWNTFAYDWNTFTDDLSYVEFILCENESLNTYDKVF